jgi:predicted RNA-binding protein with PUA-like domain
MTQFWLVKSDVEEFSISKFKKVKKTWWEGVRNYQARNFMLNSMKLGDLAFFYHSNAEPSGIVGLIKVSKAANVDKSALDKKSPYFDPKSTPSKPVWYCVEFQYLESFPRIVTLEVLRSQAVLKSMQVLKKGNRLSITTVSEKEFQTILKLAQQD